MIKLTDKPANGSGLLAIFCDLDPKDQKISPMAYE